MDSSEEELSTLSEVLLYLTTAGTLPCSLSKLNVSSSRGIPSDKDFFFYNNFQKFKNPVKHINHVAAYLLTKIGSSSHLWQKPAVFPDALDPDDLDALDWLVNANDDVFENLDKSLDEFRSRRRNLEKGKAVKMDDFDDGFQTVHGRQNRKGDFYDKQGPGLGVGVAETKAKPKIPFHIPSIPRPQDQYKIIVNNSNQPFEHVWLQKSEDGSRFVHPLAYPTGQAYVAVRLSLDTTLKVIIPLYNNRRSSILLFSHVVMSFFIIQPMLKENLSVLDFVDKSAGHILPRKPPPLEVTPFKFVEDVKDLKQLAAKLRAADEFAVDLEHNQYRSFQGLTCLMQISTRTEDFVIDTLKLRIHIGPYLREVFKDPTKKKVLHGADRDIIWLQKDFGIYVCNMFDTGQASRALKLERNSLEFLLLHICGVTANKEYQNADWRLRPLPDVMVRYAREDTHYLLYIYDMMRIRLLSASSEAENSDNLLVEVYKRSYDICLQLYEKELLTDSSYLHVYGLQDAGLNAQQLAVVAGLCEWRDAIARSEDESTGYVLPNKILVEIAKQMPLTANKLHRLVKQKSSYIERNLGSVVGVIRHSIQNAPAFEIAAQQLKERQMERAAELASTGDEFDVLHHEAPLVLNTTVTNVINASGSGHKSKSQDTVHLNIDVTGKPLKDSTKAYARNSSISLETGGCSAVLNPQISNVPKQSVETVATVQLLKKPSRAFGTLLGCSVKKQNPDKEEQVITKLEQIKSLVNLPFHSFAGNEERRQQPEPNETAARLKNCVEHDVVAESCKNSELEQIIMFDNGSDIEQTENGEDTNAPAADHIGGRNENRDDVGRSSRVLDEGDETLSLSELSTSFQECLQSSNQTEFKPFDFEAAKKEVDFREINVEVDKDNSSKRHRKGDDKRSSSSSSCSNNSSRGMPRKDEGAQGPPQGKRRQAFPASGNRSATFR